MDTPSPSTAAADATALAAVAAAIHQRRNTTPRRLVAPGANLDQLEQLLAAAAAAPDHGQLTPWRLILIPLDKREVLADVFEQALLDRDARAAAPERSAARDKALRSPTLLLAVADLSPREPDIPADERLISLGCAIQNMLLLAQAIGLGSGLSSGQAMGSTALRQAFGLHEHERAVCFVSFGTVAAALSRAKPHQRPAPGRFFSILGP
jgi:nitroreductase